MLFPLTLCLFLFTNEEVDSVFECMTFMWHNIKFIWCHFLQINTYFISIYYIWTNTLLQVFPIILNCHTSKGRNTLDYVSCNLCIFFLFPHLIWPRVHYMNWNVFKQSRLQSVCRSCTGRRRKEETRRKGIGKNLRSVHWMSCGLGHVHFKTITIKMLN